MEIKKLTDESIAGAEISRIAMKVELGEDLTETENVLWQVCCSSDGYAELVILASCTAREIVEGLES